MTSKLRVCDGCHRSYSPKRSLLFGFCTECERRIEDQYVEVVEEKKLWLTVIRQAQADAEGRGEKIDDRLIRLAKRWLTTASRSFFHVCALAGFDRIQSDLLLEQERRKWRP